MSSERQLASKGAARLTLVVTNIIKLAGVYVAVRTAIVTPNNALGYAAAGFMMAGAQFSETFILDFIDRLLGGQQDRSK